MSHQTLYRKWRPMRFSDVVGQGHITDTLKNQGKGNMLVHAYLFCGTRGTGKTTVAKILARAVNCTALLATGDPCNACEACVSIIKGSALEVVEIDAASNNGVDNVREIRDEVVYPPAAMKYRVYIIDEVHMLSQSAFNALLKTLEEPPPHVIFILATTELQKIPATVRSRCQRYDFKRILDGDMAMRLRYICEQEKIQATDEAIGKIVAMADGALRDALSLLEQCRAGSDVVDIERVLLVCGAVADDAVALLVDGMIAGDSAGALAVLERILADGKDLFALVEQVLSHLRDMMVKDARRDLVAMIVELSKLYSVMRQSKVPKVLFECFIVGAGQVEGDVMQRAVAKAIEVNPEPMREEERPQAPPPAPALENNAIFSKLQSSSEGYAKCLLGANARMVDDVLEIYQHRKAFFNLLEGYRGKMEEDAGVSIKLINEELQGAIKVETHAPVVDPVSVEVRPLDEAPPFDLDPLAMEDAQALTVDPLDKLIDKLGSNCEVK